MAMEAKAKIADIFTPKALVRRDEKLAGDIFRPILGLLIAVADLTSYGRRPWVEG